MEIFKDPKYLALLMKDYEGVVDENVKFYSDTFRDIMAEINSKELDDENLHTKLESITKIKFSEAFKQQKDYGALVLDFVRQKL